MLLSDHPLVMAEKGFPAVERAIRVMNKQEAEIEQLREENAQLQEGFIQIIELIFKETERFRGRLVQIDDDLESLKQLFIDGHKERLNDRR